MSTLAYYVLFTLGCIPVTDLDLLGVGGIYSGLKQRSKLSWGLEEKELLALVRIIFLNLSKLEYSTVFIIGVYTEIVINFNAMIKL